MGYKISGPIGTVHKVEKEEHSWVGVLIALVIGLFIFGLIIENAGTNADARPQTVQTR